MNELRKNKIADTYNTQTDNFTIIHNEQTMLSKKKNLIKDRV